MEPVGILLSHQTGCPSSEFSFGYRLNDSPCGADCGLGGIDCRHDIGSCGGIQAKGPGNTGDLAGGQHQAEAKEGMVLEYHESGDENGGLQESGQAQSDDLLAPLDETIRITAWDAEHIETATAI